MGRAARRQGQWRRGRVWPVGTCVAALVGLGVLALGAGEARVRATGPVPSRCGSYRADGPALPRIRSVGGRLYAGRTQWRAWGFNWGIGDHAPVIAYFDDPTPANLGVLACELHTARSLGANSMRVYLELGQVMENPTTARPSALAALQSLLRLAEREHV